MAKSANQKIKLYTLAKIFEEKTDENHGLRIKDLLKELEDRGVPAGRTSVVDDIDCLIADLDFDIVSEDLNEGKKKKTDTIYWLDSRDFDVAEVKLLTDLVQSSRFISSKSVDTLIGKLKGLTSVYNAQNLDKMIFTKYLSDGRVKNIFNNIDYIYHAITENMQISFEYMCWDLEKNLVKESTINNLSPWALVFAEDYYYLIGYKKDESDLFHYRIDMMDKIHFCEEIRQGLEKVKEIDFTKYSLKYIGMNKGAVSRIHVTTPIDKVGVFIDRFGEDISIRAGENKSRRDIVFDVAVTDEFFGWLSGLGIEIRLIRPEPVVEKYKNYLIRLCNNYDID